MIAVIFLIILIKKKQINERKNCPEKVAGTIQPQLLPKNGITQNKLYPKKLFSKSQILFKIVAKWKIL